MDESRLTGLVRKCMDDFNMIEEGDKIAVGVSGGKDSITLLSSLNIIQSYYPVKFEMIGILVDLGITGSDHSELIKFCNDKGIRLIIVQTKIKEIVFDVRKESNPCSLCSKMRKGALNNEAIKQGCNKIAYAHHLDDVSDTFFMSLFYENRINTLSPIINLDDSPLKIIRPLIYVTESEVKGFVKKYSLPVEKSFCPIDKKTNREDVKDLVNDINKMIPGVRKKVFSAIKKTLYNKEK